MRSQDAGAGRGAWGEREGVALIHISFWPHRTDGALRLSASWALWLQGGPLPWRDRATSGRYMFPEKVWSLGYYPCREWESELTHSW